MMTRHNNIGKFNIIMETIDELLPLDARVRLYDKAIDWNFIYPLVEDLYSDFGKPSIDPIVLFKLIFLNYIEGIHSMRKTCERCKTDIAYRWFLRINFDEKIPNHSTVSQNLRRKFIGTKVFEQIFYFIVKEAYRSGFIDNTNVFGDSTHVKACANKKKFKDAVVEETKNIYYDDLKKDINKSREDHGKKPFEFDDENEKPNKENTSEADDKLIKSADEEEIVNFIEDEKGNIVKYVVSDPETGELIEKDAKKKFKHSKESTVDPDAGFYHKGEHEKQFAYSAGALCDKNCFIVEAYITSGNIHDSISFDGLFNNFKKNFLFETTDTICLDAGYNSPSVARTVLNSDKNILLPYTRPRTKDGFFKKREYVYDEENDCYLCPNDQVIPYATTNKDGYAEYKSDGKKCANCPFLGKCTASKNHVKTITRHVWSDFMEKAEDFRYQLGSREIYKKRKETIERCFGDGKENFGLRFTRYKGLERVKSNILLIFSCMNLKKLALWKAKTATTTL